MAKPPDGKDEDRLVQRKRQVCQISSRSILHACDFARKRTQCPTTIWQTSWVCCVRTPAATGLSLFPRPAKLLSNFQATFIKRLSWSTLLVIQSDLLGFVCCRAEADLARDVVRKYGIDSFGHYRMKIRNPDSILKEHCLCLLCTSLRSACACVRGRTRASWPCPASGAAPSVSAASRPPLGSLWVARWLP